jgi:DNA polymerase (family 10)
MPRPNDEVAALLGEYAELISITGGDAFRARTYARAARSIKGHSADVSQLDPGGLRQISGVGKSVADRVAEFLTTGRISVVEELRARIPPGVREMTAIPALGPSRALQLHAELGIASVTELTEAIRAGRLRDLKGFGAKSEERILRGIELLSQTGERVLLSVGLETAEQIVAALAAVPGCVSCTYAGSLRRMRETAGDVDILAAVPDAPEAWPDAAAAGPAGADAEADDTAARLTAAFTALPQVAEVIASGGTKTSVRTQRGLQVDLLVVPAGSWGAALQYFTGSQAHNVRIREIAVRQGLRLSEYGLFSVETGELIVSQTEEEIYAALGMSWVPPTLREDGGEIEAALRGELPDLVSEQDLRGDLHTHTDLTDGVSSLADMVAAAAARGYEYYAITDHAPDLIMHRMTDEKMLAQREQVRKLGETTPMTLLHGSELNIGPDGTVDWPADFLAGFDICVASVHSHFGQPRKEMTRRFVRACENPYVNVIGHPLTRIIGRRAPVDVDLDELFAACARTGTALEVNGSPHRLDLPAEHLRRAREAGVKFAIDSDAHATVELDRPRYGIGTAQRGWLAADDVINTWPLGRLREFLRKGRPA